jgi:2-keto-3-deoxy-L-rhamnonate aldolase RhmA
MAAGIELQPGERDIFRIVQAIISYIRKWNASGQITLRANQTTTTVTKAISPGAFNVAVGDEIMLSPRTANAAAALATTWISAVGQGTYTLTHASNGQTDKTYGYGVR